MADYPNYIHGLLTQAEGLVEEDVVAAVALCYEVLGLFPDCLPASELIYEAFCDPRLIRAQRQEIGRSIDEWDDRPWQHRCRLAASFNSLSQWDVAYFEKYGHFVRQIMPMDVEALLDEGQMQLIQAATLGIREGEALAWALFEAAVVRSTGPERALLWLAAIYMEYGYFAEAVDWLEQLLARFEADDIVRSLWGELVWWRDNAHRLPWIPPQTTNDGSRWRRMMAQVDADFAAEPQLYAQTPPHVPPNMSRLPDDLQLPTPMPVALMEKIAVALADVSEPPSLPALVDWQYLDQLETAELDVASLPSWAQYLLLELDTPEQESYVKWWLLHYLSNPPFADEDDHEG